MWLNKFTIIRYVINRIRQSLQLSVCVHYSHNQNFRVFISASFEIGALPNLILFQANILTNLKILTNLQKNSISVKVFRNDKTLL